MESSPTQSTSAWQRFRPLLLALPIIYIVLLLGQPAGFDIPRIVENIRNDPTIIIQQLINGIASGAIIAIIALGYTMVYGIIELVNFANGDVYMLGAMAALFALSPFIIFDPNTGGQSAPWWAALLGFIPAMGVGALINYAAERIAYRRLRNSPKIVNLISAIGMSFILQNVGLQLASVGKLAIIKDEVPLFGLFEVFGRNNAAPKSFPSVFSDDNLIDLVIAPPPLPTPNVAATAEAEATEAAALAQPTVGNSAPAAEATPTLDDIAAAEETAIIGTLEAEHGSATPSSSEPITAGGDAIASDATPTLDAEAAAEETAIIGTLEAENGAATPSADKIAAAALAQDATPTLDAEAAAEETAIIGTLEAENGTATPSSIEPISASGGDATAAADAAAQEEAQALADQPVATNTIRLTWKNVIVIVVALVLMGALNWFVQNTRLGKAMRATAQNRAAAQIMGINVDNIISLTFVIGGALAGAAGMMSGIYSGTAVFTMGFTAGLRSFTAAVLGGIGNIRGAALGGILIGIISAFSDQFLSVRWTNAWVFLILVLVLVFRPTGLLGSESGEKA